MPLNPSNTFDPATASHTRSNEATHASTISASNPLQPVQEVAAQPTSLADPHKSAPTGLSFTTSAALQRAGVLPSSTNMAATTASETLQRVMGHSASTNGASPSTPTQAGPLTPAQLKNMTPAQANAALQNPVGNVPTVYLATYSNVPVYEITVRGIAVMRRRGDGWLNATQILKIAGIEKTRRTKILEKSILTGEHEKIQGGYGKFQGTWIPLQRAQEVAAEYNVSHLLQPILEFDPATADQIPKLYQRKKPASSARNSSASAINDGRSATPGGGNGKNYSPAPSSTGGVGGPSQQPRFLSLRPPKGEGQREMSPALFMPPGASLLGSFADGGVQGPQAIPPGSSQAEQEALRSYNLYGYVPQGIPLPSSTDAGTGEKRAAEGGEQGNAKRSRIASPQRDSGLLLGPSPVKDLNALGPAGGSLRAASAPSSRGNRMVVGAPNAEGRDGSVPRYADRALPPKPYDEGEKRVRDHLVSLFADENVLSAGTAAESGAADGAASSNTAEGEDTFTTQLDTLLSDLREKSSLGLAPSDGPKPSVDLVTDDHGHTALHWASALCRLNLVRTLVARPPPAGANVHAGNHAGETALHRSVLVTNSYDSSAFPVLLSLLEPSLNTRDFKKRTVLHHIALVAALKGRAASARYYLACVLEFVAREKMGRYKGLLDAQDEDGETALGIVARLGNASMVRMLLEAGARKDLPNSLGIRPSDWGIDPNTTSPQLPSSLPDPSLPDLAGTSAGDIISSLTRPAQPVMKSSDVREQLSSTLEELQGAFERELGEKQDALATVQSHLQAATRDLAGRRRRVGEEQERVREKEESKLRGGNLTRAIRSWLGWEEEGAEVKVEELVAEASSLGDAMDVDSSLPDIKPPSLETFISTLLSPSSTSSDSTEELIRLRFLLQFFSSTLSSLSTTLSSLEESTQLKEGQCKQVVAICANIAPEKVEGMLEELLTAMESDGPDVDLARVAGFMQKVGGGGGLSASTSGSTEVSKGSQETVASSVVPSANGEGEKV